MNKLWVPYRRHAATFLLGAVPPLLASLVGLAVGSPPLALAPLAVAATPILIAAILWFVCLFWDRRLRRLAAESPLLLHWTLDAQPWRRHVEAQQTKARLVGPLIAIMLAGVGLFVGGLLAGDGEAIGGSVALTWLVPAAACGAAGAFVWWLVHWNAESTRRRRLCLGGQLLLGRNGFYLTGEYRPLQGSQTLTGAAVLAEGSESKLVLTWYVSAGRCSRDQTVEVPIPPGREAEAHAAVRLLNGDEADGRQA